MKKQDLNSRNTIEYTLIRRKRKSIGITISPEKGVQVSAPSWVGKAQIEEILKQKAHWIYKKLQLIEDMKSQKAERKFISGEVFPLLGKDLNLEVLYKAGTKNTTVVPGVERLFVVLPSGLSDDKQEARIREALTGWFMEQAASIIRKRMDIYADRLNVKPAKLLLKSQKTRWGSCTRDNKININWKIVSAPLDIVDYLVVHELAHIRVKNHSKTYWELVESILPDYRERRKWLKANGHRLGF